MDIGRLLQEARERRGVTLHQIAATTKLSMATLRLIESNQIDELPGGILRKGYLRAYGATVGPDAIRLVDQYLQFRAAAEAAEPPVERPRPPNWPVPASAATSSIALGAWLWLQPVPQPASHPHALPNSMLVDFPTAAPGTVRPQPAEPIAADLLVRISPTGPCWVSATADGEVVLDRRLDVGDHVTLRARERLVIRVGDPSTFIYTVNGRPGRALGLSEEPVTLDLTMDDLDAFLARRDGESS